MYRINIGIRCNDTPSFGTKFIFTIATTGAYTDIYGQTGVHRPFCHMRITIYRRVKYILSIFLLHVFSIFLDSYNF